MLEARQPLNGEGQVKKRIDAKSRRVLMKAIGRRKFLMAAAAVLMSMLLVAGQAAAGDSGGGGEIVQLQIITVNDFHGALMENGKNPGAAKLAEYIKERRAHNPAGTLLLGAGDMFTGTPDSNLLYGKPVVDIMNYARFDAMTLGNHEFDWGIDRLKERIAQSDFPYVCANLLDKSTGRPADFVKPYVIVKRLGVNIAIIGIATPETAYKTNPKLIAGYTFEDPAVVVNGLVPELKRKGADIVVVLSHLASWMDGDGNISGDAATLAGQARGIDAIVSAHSHQPVYGKVNGVPVIQASYNGRAAGEIAMTLTKAADGWKTPPSVLLLCPIRD
jgi:5'-nucleotidase/UDP-sugar diphosphatase